MKLLGALGIDWRVFLIQVLNFVVLFWILKVLFYKPFITAIKRERKKAEDIKNGKEKLQAEEEEMRKREQEIIRQARIKAQGILAKTRTISQEEKGKIIQRTTEEIKKILEDAKKKAQVIIEESQEQNKQKIIQKSEEIVQKVLSESLSQDIHQRYLKEAVSNLSKLDLNKVKATDVDVITVVSAFPLSKEDKQLISNVLFKKLGTAAFRTEINKKLLLGIKIISNDFIIDSSLQDKVDKVISHEG